MDRSRTCRFRFGNGRSDSSIGVVTLPAGLGNNLGTLSFHVMDAEVPLLIGADVFEQCGAVVNHGKHTVHFENLADKSPHELWRLPSGHLAANIFPDENFVSVPFKNE